jgi:hypothetical protein
MPKIRDLGISVIPVTMRPPEIGGGAADMYQAQGQPSGQPAPGCVPTAPQCIPTNEPQCVPTAPQCIPTNEPQCVPTNQPCNPTPPQCQPTPMPQCCPTNETSVCSGRGADAVALPDEAVLQLRQQLQQQIGATLVN